MENSPKLTVVLDGVSLTFDMYWESECVSVGGVWEKGLAMCDAEYEKLLSAVGEYYLANLPMYCYNEGLDVSGMFENLDGVAIGTWNIAL